MLALGADVEVDAAEMLKEYTASAEAARLAKANEKVALEEADKLRLEIVMKGAEVLVVKTTLAGALAGAESTAENLREELREARHSRHASALATLATTARARIDRRASNGALGELSDRAAAAEAKSVEAARDAEIITQSVAHELQVAEGEAMAAESARQAAVERADKAVAAAELTARDLATERRDRQAEAEANAKRLEEVSARAMAEARAVEHERERKESALRTSTEIEHAAVEAVVDVLRSELAASQKNHRDEVESLESTCQLHMVRAQQAEARLKELQGTAAAEQQAHAMQSRADKVEALTLRMELSDVCL